MSKDEWKKRVIVKILGEEYVISSPSSSGHMHEVAEHIDKLMIELCEKYPRMSMQKIAVLASLNLASDLLSLQRDRRDKKDRKR
ncbi:MAG: cell division protein ZapA [Bacillota bacterium]|nr:cell division protein ZapA [Bacillota bacterium]